MWRVFFRSGVHERSGAMAALRLKTPWTHRWGWKSLTQSAHFRCCFGSLVRPLAVGTSVDKLASQRSFSQVGLGSWVDPLAYQGSFTSWVDPLDLEVSPQISEKEVYHTQRAYAKAIMRISNSYHAGGNYLKLAHTAVERLYTDDKVKVLFKANEAKDTQFRPTAAEAMAFIAGAKGDAQGSEESSFAIIGSRGWSDVGFDNHQIEISDNVAIASGTCYLTSAETNGITEADFTFGYRKDELGKVGIFFQNSSVPLVVLDSFDAKPLVSEEAVQKAQAAWASTIKDISKIYLDGGDYVAAAAKAAGDLYGYGHSEVLFKPTKAAEAQFRPSASDALSYFVGHQAVEGGHSEDSGFAINGGKGWSDVVFENHKTNRTGNIAIAMGNYYFTCAETGNQTKVEYTFGYKMTKDGKLRIFLHHSSVPYDPETSFMISEEEVQAAQAAWASAIKNISKVYLARGDYVAAAAEAAGELYGYGHSQVLFKPTKAAEAQFRPSASDALSYFVGHQAVEGGHSEDSGFAINGGKGWSDVVFENHQTKLTGPIAISMGNYHFTCAETGNQTKVEYTFGYKKNMDGKLRIFLHHSSVPYTSSSATVVADLISQEEVQSAQAAWASAIKHISKTYLDGGDYVAAAEKAAGELYGYGHSEVLFKPTKAAEAQFRPSASDAMSYFVGHDAVEGGHSEDSGFAINGGKGWSDVKFENHQTKLTGDLAIAMGNYYFTCAETGNQTKVEYTFGYKKTEDGKLRIFLHHSSVPYSS